MTKIDDKTLHVWAGMVIAIAVTLILFYFTEVNIYLAYLIALSTGVIAGAFKEWIYDKALKLGTFSYLDFYCTIWGSFIGTIASIAITQYISSK